VTKILYVEDDDDNVFMLKMRLELLGDFEVLTAEDGEKGCAMAVSECPDIILMDLEMPVVDGWEASRRLKGNPQKDNDDNVFMLKMRLELLGDFEVLTAEDGEKGCVMALSERPDIILMDLEMPVVDGWEATRRLKGDPQTRDIPIIALSAHALAGEREKALAAGCNEFDTKPIEFDRLVAIIRRMIAPHPAGVP
jgi:two-component system, cell cycle response regulator DivK